MAACVCTWVYLYIYIHTPDPTISPQKHTNQQQPAYTYLASRLRVRVEDEVLHHGQVAPERRQVQGGLPVAVHVVGLWWICGCGCGWFVLWMEGGGG